MSLIFGNANWNDDEDESSSWDDGNLFPTGLGSELREERRGKKKRDKRDDGNLMPTGIGHDD